MKTISKFVTLCTTASLLGAVVWMLWSPGSSASKIVRTIEDKLAEEWPLAAGAEVAPALPSSDQPRVTSSAPGEFDVPRLLAGIASCEDVEVRTLVDQILDAKTPIEKGSGADALAARGGFEAIANLLRVAGLHQNPDCRAAILDGLKNLHDEEGFATLASTVAATHDPQFLEAAVENLARSSSPAVLATLVNLYRERIDAPMQKNQVLRAITAMRHPELVRPLGKLALHAEEPALAEAAAVAWQYCQGSSETP